MALSSGVLIAGIIFASSLPSGVYRPQIQTCSSILSVEKWRGLRRATPPASLLQPIFQGPPLHSSDIFAGVTIPIKGG